MSARTFVLVVWLVPVIFRTQYTSLADSLRDTCSEAMAPAHFLGRIVIMRLILSHVHGLLVRLSVIRSVSLSLVTRMYCGKTAGPIEMPFGMWGGVGHSNHVLDGGPDPPMMRGNFGGFPPR